MREKVIQYTPVVALACNALAVGIRFVQVGCELAGNQEAAELVGLVATAAGNLGLVTAAFDFGLTAGLHIANSEKLYGEHARWTRKERIAIYLLAATNWYLAINSS